MIRTLQPDEVLAFMTRKQAEPLNEMMIKFEDQEGNYILFYNSDSTEKIHSGELIPDGAHIER